MFRTLRGVLRNSDDAKENGSVDFLNASLCYKQSVSGYLFAIVLALSTSSSLFAQCPSVGTPTEVRTLQGRLIFHDGIQKWFELKVDKPPCAEGPTELFEQDSNSLAIFRGCQIKSHGELIISARGITRQIVEQIEPVGRCVLKAPFPDFSNVKPDSAIREYRVEMHVNGTHPIHFRVSQAGKVLRPWQPYASYFLTGAFLLYGSCADGFVVDKVFGTPEANPAHALEARGPVDQAMFDLERAAESGRLNPDLGFTCVRP